MMRAVGAVIFCLFFATMASAQTPLSDTAVGTFVDLKGKVVETVQSGSDFWLRVDITPIGDGYWKDTIVVTYRAVSPLQQQIPEKTIIGFQGWYRGLTSYKTVQGITNNLPLVDACMLWNENDGLRFVRPPNCQ